MRWKGLGMAEQVKCDHGARLSLAAGPMSQLGPGCVKTQVRKQNMRESALVCNLAEGSPKPSPSRARFSPRFLDPYTFDTAWVDSGETAPAAAGQAYRSTAVTPERGSTGAGIVATCHKRSVVILRTLNPRVSSAICFTSIEDQALCTAPGSPPPEAVATTFQGVEQTCGRGD